MRLTKTTKTIVTTRHLRFYVHDGWTKKEVSRLVPEYKFWNDPNPYFLAVSPVDIDFLFANYEIELYMEHWLIRDREEVRTILESKNSLYKGEVSKKVKQLELKKLNEGEV